MNIEGGRPTAELPVRAYTDALSYERGRTVRLHVSAAEPVDVSLVRMRSASAADTSLDAPVEWAPSGSYVATPQQTCVGSFLLGALSASVPPTPAVATIGAFVWSGDFASTDVQTLVALESGPALQLRRGRPALSAPGASEPLVLDMALVNHCWYLVIGTLGEERSVTAVPVDPLYGAAGTTSGPGAGLAQVLVGAVTVGARGGRDVVTENGLARGLATEHFNGKIEAPFVAAQGVDARQVESLARGGLQVEDLELAAAWDLSFRHGDEPSAATPVAAVQPPGVLVNGPARGVAGRSFTGRSADFNVVPSEYAAVHFHATDLVDAGWDVTLEAALPEDLESGVYGLVVENAAGSDTVPIVVAPRPTDERTRVLVVLPTFTYLAYANESLFNGLDASAMTDQEVTISPEDLAHVGDASFGLSMYDVHPDGSGVMLSAARRQIVNMRRGYRMWLLDAGRAFSADMYLIEWLTRRGIEVDVVTDHEVHARGSEYLAPYAAVVSGSHPEYTTEQMLDNLLAYRDGGGSLLYLGGNGWYWVTGVLSEGPLVVEIRRGYAGVRCWESLPGEVTLMSTGLPGGLWRHRGRAPQALAGVGFAAQGWGKSEPYFRSQAAAAEEWKWVYDGVEDDPIGDYGLVMGGAAGDEIDRVDQALGTPPGAVVLASSRGHSNFYQRVVEEIPMSLPDHGGGEQDPEVHADIVYFTTPGGGEVFSTGSIAWSGALLHNATDNGVSRMTENVIREFVSRRAPREDAG